MKKYFILSIFLIGSLVVSAQQNDRKKLTLDNVFKSRILNIKSLSGVKPMNDGETYCRLVKDSINVYSYKTGDLVKTVVTRKDLIPEGKSEPVDMGDYFFSPGETKIVFAANTEPIYRYSSVSDFYIYDLPTKKLTALSENGKQRLADFNPGETMIAFVRGNNLWIKDLTTGTETMVTNDGKQNYIINGTTDWVYEEEFAITKGFYWSPDGSRIAYMRFDESEVKEFVMLNYGELYPVEHRFKYPKAGEANSLVTLHVYDLKTAETKTIDLGPETDQYIPRFQWTTQSHQLAVQRMNRLQNLLEILLIDVNTGKTEIIYKEQNKYYIEITDNLTFLKDGKHFIFTNETDGFNHIYMYDMTGKMIKQLTKGNWDVTEMKGIDETNRQVYYMAAQSSPLNRELCVTNFDGKMKTISVKEGTDRPQFSATYNYFINAWTDANTPPVVTVNKSDGKVIRTVYDNQQVITTMNEFNLPVKEFFKFTTSEGVELNGWMMRPPDFDPGKKYPVLFNIYGGPNSQTVLNSFGRSLWDHYLAQEGIIIVSVDNRGTGARGEAFRKITYGQLGKYETIDMIESAKYLATLDFVDAEKIGVFGWSYGGFMAASCMTVGADYFSTGISVAPVINYRYYDNIYTERYMGLPRDNPDGYDKNSPIYHAGKLKGNLLIIHGLSDDNVHAQNTFDFFSALVAANKQFDMKIYPNSNHGIYTGENTTFHLFSGMTDYLFKHLLNKQLPQK